LCYERWIEIHTLKLYLLKQIKKIESNLYSVISGEAPKNYIEKLAAAIES